MALAPAYPERRRSHADALVLFIWLFPILLSMIGTLVAVAALPTRFWRPTLGFLAFMALSELVPLRIAPAFFQACTYRFCEAYRRWCSVSVVFQDPDAFKPGQAYLIAYEPHSALPIGMAMFSKYSRLMPPGLQNTRILLSTAMLWSALTRHLLWVMGCRPVSREVIRHLLGKGASCVLNPGGIQECGYMERNSENEHVFLRRRRGFVRLAMESGAPLVPAFAFGQSATMSFLRPHDLPLFLPHKLVARFARLVRFYPMAAWGYGPTAVPKPHPVTIVVGKPIPVPQPQPKPLGAPAAEGGQRPRAEPPAGAAETEVQGQGQGKRQAAAEGAGGAAAGATGAAEADEALVDEYLHRFIAALEELFEAHKAEAGQGHGRLVVH